ncbi:Nramp family divalent metal transporter [Pontibacillus salicampi]|uniref:Nramp family divalent metal transporter n=1 Tax=Pontibacillus salicampi TaxID=1449801 RepID=A0ABV6LI22_9BACI
MEIKKEQGTTTFKTRKSSWLVYIGPAFITSALVLGPGSLTLSSKIGAIYGNQLIWIVLVAILLMVAFTEMSTRIGIASHTSFIQLIQQRWGKWGAILAGVGAFLVTASFQAGNSIGIGVASSMILGGAPVMYIVLFTLAGALLLFAKDFYTVLEKLMIGLVLLMLASFLLTVVLTKPSVGDISTGLIPTVPTGSLPLIIAFTATCFSVVGASYQSYLVQEKGWTRNNASQGIKESFIGIFLLGLISLLVMIAAAAILKPEGIQINTVAEMGQALSPIYGDWATIIFMLGLFGASFSSIMGNATIGGAMLSDGIGIGHSLSNKKVKLAIIGVMLFGSIVAIVFGSAPIELIIFAQAVTIVIVPFIAIALLQLANDEQLMGDLKNTPLKNGIAIVGIIILILLAINNVYSIFIQ